MILITISHCIYRNTYNKNNSNDNNNNVNNNSNKYQSFTYLPNKLICLLLHKSIKKSSVEITTTTNTTESIATPALLQSGSLPIRFCAFVNRKKDVQKGKEHDS